MKLQESKHYFFLNPYEDYKFTRCPKCDNTTKVRKKPYLIHVEPKNLLCVNMTGKYCLYCDLFIIQQDVIEQWMAYACEKNGLDHIIGNPYLVMGTLDRKYFKEGFSYGKDYFEKYNPFKKHLDFTVQPAGWYKT